MKQEPQQSADIGRVFIVGAGPGDPGLLTLKGRDCIARADVIFYDALVNTALLEHVRSGARTVYVGKKAGSHRFTQARINAMLAEEAAAGRCVCRLKGGDPFVFGRGGEELLYLRRRDIPVTVVPGVSAAIAVPACAGIPVTHRGSAASVRIITGHEAAGNAGSQLPWEHFARESGTLVVLMGHQNLESIAAHLMAHGMPGSTPAAVISNGTLADAQWVAAPLGGIACCARNAHLTTPATLVIGEVVRLMDETAEPVARDAPLSDAAEGSI